MNAYLIVKTLHILSATLMVGTGFGTAFYLFWANRSGSVAAQAVVGKWVIKADWWFTTPAVIFQPLSGLWLLHQMGMPLTWSGAWLWVKWTLALYALALSALPALLGAARLPRVLRHRGDLFFNGNETDLTRLIAVGLQFRQPEKSVWHGATVWFCQCTACTQAKGRVGNQHFGGFCAIRRHLPR